jgi:hypothetical protein
MTFGAADEVDDNFVDMLLDNGCMFAKCFSDVFEIEEVECAGYVSVNDRVGLIGVLGGCCGRGVDSVFALNVEVLVIRPGTEFERIFAAPIGLEIGDRPVRILLSKSFCC